MLTDVTVQPPITFKDWIFAHLFSLTLFFTIFFQLLTVLILHIYYKKEDTSFATAEAYYLSIMGICQWSIVFVSTYVLRKHIWLTDLGPIFYLYLAKMVAFSGVYLILYVVWEDSTFDYPDWLVQNQGYWDKAVICTRLPFFYCALRTCERVDPFFDRKKGGSRVSTQLGGKKGFKYSFTAYRLKL